MTADQWDDRREIKSETSGRIYTVSRRISTGMYECSCPGWKSRRTCKHLRTMGLPTAGPLQNTAQRRPRTMSPSAIAARRSFADSKKHYDPMAEGYGDPSEWAEAAKRMAAGKGALKAPAVSANRAAANGLQHKADMAAIGISAMPATADGLLAAYQARAEVLNDPVSGDPDEFWRAFASYERLIKSY